MIPPAMQKHLKKALRAVTPLGFEPFKRARWKVRREMIDLGLWCDKLDSCQVWLRTVPERGMWGAYGYQWFGDREDGRLVGDIVLPSVSPAMWGNYLRWCYGEKEATVVDVLRHEYGHAFADANPRRMNSPKFERAFGYPHESESWDGWKMDYDPEHHVSEYAATNPMEDFAENFQLYLKHRGILPLVHQTGPIRERWKFIKGLRK